MAVVDVAGHTLLAAAYSDVSLRLWDLGRQACLLHSSLLPSAAQQGLALPTHTAFAPPPADEPGRPGKLVVQLDEPGQAAGASRFYAYELYGSAGAGASLTGLDMQQVKLLFWLPQKQYMLSLACLAYHLCDGHLNICQLAPLYKMYPGIGVLAFRKIGTVLRETLPRKPQPTDSYS